ncbi:MAG: hypothetical protein AAFR38_14130 [Planctomycetota bacterium]
MAVIVAVAGSVASAQVIDFEGITVDILNVSDVNPLETQGFLFTPENQFSAVFGPVPTGTATFPGGDSSSFLGWAPINIMEMTTESGAPPALITDDRTDHRAASLSALARGRCAGYSVLQRPCATGTRR